jgi:hypothetical protein
VEIMKKPQAFEEGLIICLMTILLKFSID